MSLIDIIDQILEHQRDLDTIQRHLRRATNIDDETQYEIEDRIFDKQSDLADLWNTFNEYIKNRKQNDY